MKLTLAITVYNRWEMLLESFAGVIDDNRIDEILIMDDHSDDEYWKKIKDLPSYNPKIKVVRQLTNRGMSVNKRDAILNSKNEWVIIFDSDNVIGKDYLDAVWTKSTDPKIIYCPSFAMPNFDFREFEGSEYDGKLTAKYIKKPMFNTLMNCCNYLVNRSFYLQCWKENKEMKGSDTIWHAFNHLQAGGVFVVVKEMYYMHRVHKGSGFAENMEYNLSKAEETRKMIQSL